MVTEPTTPAGRDEHDHWHRVVGDACNDFRPHLCHHLSRVAAIEKQARAEGRQEAVTEIRERLNIPREGFGQLLREVLDEVAHYGRSSDPEPAPPLLDVTTLAQRIHNDAPYSGLLGANDCDCRERARRMLNEVSHYASLAGADPALQATGEPPAVYRPILAALAHPCHEPIHQQAAEALSVLRAGATGEGDKG